MPVSLSVCVCMYGCVCMCSFSDIRFIEVMESVCSRILQYNLHKERGGSNRFAKVRQSLLKMLVWFRINSQSGALFTMTSVPF